MNLHNLKNQELNSQLKSLACKERKITSLVIWHIAEVDQRKLYLGMAYPSLFEYLVKEIGYSEGAAQRRIDAARLSRQVPAIKDKLESGALSLSQASLIHSGLREAAKQQQLGQVKNTDYAYRQQQLTQQKELAEKLIEKLENKSHRESQAIVASELALPIQKTQKEKVQADESVRIELVLSKEEAALLSEAKAYLSQAVPSTSTKDVFMYLLHRLMKQREAKQNPQGQKPIPKQTNHDAKTISTVTTSSAATAATADVAVNMQSVVTVDTQTTIAVENTLAAQVTKEDILKTAKTQKAAKPKTISSPLRRFIFKRDQRCQFKDKNTGKICGSKHFLELDHVLSLGSKGYFS